MESSIQVRQHDSKLTMYLLILDTALHMTRPSIALL